MSEAPSKTQRKRSFLLTLGSGQLLTLLTMGAAFLATPFLLRHLGPERFGTWRVMESWLVYFGILTQCVTLTVGFKFVPLLAVRDPVALRRFVNAAWLVVTGSSLLSFVILLALVPILPRFVTVPEGLEQESFWSFVIVVSASVLFAPILLLKVVSEADQKGYWMSAVLAAQSLTTTGLAVFLASTSTGLIGQAVASVGGLVVQASLIGLLVIFSHSWVRLGQPGMAEIKSIVQGTRSIVILGVLGGIASKIEYPLVNSLYGAEVTASYALSQRIFLIYAGLIAGIGNALWAPITDLYSRGEHDILLRRLEQSITGTAVLGFGGSVVVAAFTPAFLRLWVGDGFFLPGSGWAFAVLFPILGLNSLMGWVFAATQHNRDQLYSTSLYFSVGGVAAYLFGRIEAAGVGWGVALGLGVSICVNIWFLRRRFDVSPFRVIRQLVIVAVSALAYGAILMKIVTKFPPTSWFSLLISMGISWALFLGVASLIFIPSDERALLIQRFRKTR
jgi:O-antigen/teichoic acid export membrane protein